MPERATVFQTVQVGVEATPGTAVAANKKLQAMFVEASVASTINRFRPMGTKFDTITAMNQEWVEADLSGQPTYTEMIYPLSSVLTTGVVTTIMDAAQDTLARQWVFSPSSIAEDNPKTFTVESGSGFRAHRFAYGIVNEFGLSFTRTSTELSGSMIGQRLQDAITMTTAPTAVDLIPITSDQIDVYMDATFGGLGTTKLARALAVEWNISDRYNPLWVLDSTKNSYVTHVETAPDASLSVTVEADADGMAMLTHARDEVTRFFQVKGTGPNIYTGGVVVNHLMKIDQAGKIDEIGEFSDEDGVYAIQYTWRAVHDSAWNKALQVTMINRLTAL